MKKSLVALAFGTLALGIAEFVMMGILPEGMYRNREFAEAKADLGAFPTALLDVLFDPQTCGGLLAAVPAAAAPATQQALVDAGFPAAIIGKVISGPPRIDLR